MATKKNKYEVLDATGDKSQPAITVEAETYRFDSQSGRHIFSNGKGEDEELVANLLNVSVRKLA